MVFEELIDNDKISLAQFGKVRYSLAIFKDYKAEDKTTAAKQ